MTKLRGTLLHVLLASARAMAVTLEVSATGGNASSPLLYGIMFEDINNSGDGGIHGQLLRNNGFQGSSPDLTAYAAVGNATLAIDNARPLTSALPRSLRVSVPAGAAGRAGFANAGYGGVPVGADTYAASFWVSGAYDGDVALALVGPGGAVYAQQTVTVASRAGRWSHYETALAAQQSHESGNLWHLTFDAAKVAGGALWFGLPQLFPTTYHGRTNGLRNDVASFLEQMAPSFLRFPGGNNIEGATPSTRWKWNETIGPVQDRPGRQGDWGYANTDALGLMEYMQWCMDMSMEPLLAVWSGLSLGGGVVSGSALEPYVADILDELEFLLGDAATTRYGALRASYGRAEPYALRYVEVGNEDMLSGGCATYASRLAAIHAAVSAAYPALTLVASTSQASCLPAALPDGMYTDTHHYLTPDGFVALFDEWDNVGRRHGVLVGEYASTSGNDGRATYWSDMQGSCAEAVYMIGMERNSDVVKMASFAPLLEHFGMAEWSPDLFGLNSTVGSITGSTSFWVQHVFFTHRGDTILPVKSDSAFGPVYWVASSRSGSSYFVKLANYGSAEETVTVRFPDQSFSSSASLSLVSGGEHASNYPGAVSITPKSSSVSGSASEGYTFTMPAWGVAVLAAHE